MKTRRATELSNKSGEILEQAQTEPVLVTKGKNLRPFAVIMSFDKYAQLTESEEDIVRGGQDMFDSETTIGVNVGKETRPTGTLAASRVPVNGPPD